MIHRIYGKNKKIQKLSVLSVLNVVICKLEVVQRHDN
nr:MAG TPA: hypothetical protein [Caudoviricetes sp.]